MNATRLTQATLIIATLCAGFIAQAGEAAPAAATRVIVLPAVTVVGKKAPVVVLPEVVVVGKRQQPQETLLAQLVRTIRGSRG